MSVYYKHVLYEYVGPDAGICSSVNVLPRQVTLVWVWLDQLMAQNLFITEYTLTCPNGTAITTSATTVNITTIPFTNYTCTLTAQTNLGIIPLSTCMFETPQDSK